jgi:outer membrane protein TolC
MRLLAAAAAVLVLASPLRAQRVDTLGLSLEDAVARAQETSEEARLADAQVQVAGAQLVSARASVLPQLRLSGSYNHVMASARAQAVNSIYAQPNTYNINANLSQNLFQGGREFAALRAAQRTRSAAELTEEETRAQLALDVQRAYLGAVLAGQLVGIQEANLELARSQLEQVQRFEAAGRAARYDVLRARVQRANLEPLLIQAQNDRELAELELKRLVNVPVEQPLRLTTEDDTAALARVVAEVERSVGEGERASLRAAELTEQAQREGVRIARADFLPTVSVFVQSGFQAYPTMNRLPELRGQVITIDCPPGGQEGRVCTTQNGGFFGDRSLGVQLSWSLFDGLRAKGGVDLARAQARVAQLELARTREAVAIEVAAARATLTRSRSLFEANRQNVAEAQEAYRLATLRYSRGLSTQLEVQDAQLALLTAEINLARSANDLYLAAAELARASGATIPTPGAARP